MVPSREHQDLRRGAVDAGRRLLLAPAADLTAAATVRTRLAAWLTELGWPPAHRDDLVLAVNEAVSNSIEHGYGLRPGNPGRPGVVEVVAEILTTGGERRVEIAVRDRGTWRTPPRLRDHRRHGIPIMKACAADCVIDGTAYGTTVVLRSRPVPS
ncbi:MAG: ATP-binding protein [Pseudonocardia sp.]|nr:ATP-binding protein [Pseudonocardia sp.]